MSFEDFQHLARLYIIGALDAEEMAQLEQGRGQFGEQADSFIEECRRLESVFALSLQPVRAREGSKGRLMGMIAASRGTLASRQEQHRRTGRGRPMFGAGDGEI